MLKWIFCSGCLVAFVFCVLLLGEEAGLLNFVLEFKRTGSGLPPTSLMIYLVVGTLVVCAILYSAPAVRSPFFSKLMLASLIAVALFYGLRDIRSRLPQYLTPKSSPEVLTDDVYYQKANGNFTQLRRWTQNRIVLVPSDQYRQKEWISLAGAKAVLVAPALATTPFPLLPAKSSPLLTLQMNGFQIRICAPIPTSANSFLMAIPDGKDLNLFDSTWGAP